MGLGGSGGASDALRRRRLARNAFARRASLASSWRLSDLGAFPVSEASMGSVFNPFESREGAKARRREDINKIVCRLCAVMRIQAAYGRVFERCFLFAPSRLRVKTKRRRAAEPALAPIGEPWHAESLAFGAESRRGVLAMGQRPAVVAYGLDAAGLDRSGLHRLRSETDRAGGADRRGRRRLGRRSLASAPPVAAIPCDRARLTAAGRTPCAPGYANVTRRTARFGSSSL